MPDTGTSQSIVSADTARAANLHIRPTLTEVRNTSNGIMNLLGEANVVLCNDKHSAHTGVLVVSDLNHSALIGWQDLQKLRFIPALFPAVAAVAQCFKDLKTKTLSAFPSVFSDTLDNKPMCAQRMGSTSRTTVCRTVCQLHALFHSGFKSRLMQRYQSTLLPEL